MLTKRNGIYYLDFIAANGRRVRRSTKSTDKKLAQRLHDELKVKAWRERHLGEKPRRSWREAVVRFLKETTHKRSHRTDVLRLRWLDRFLGNIYLDQIDSDLLSRISDARTSDGLKPASVNQTLGLVRTICRRAHRDWQWLDKEIPVRMLPVSNERDRVLAEDEEVRLLAALPKHLREPVRFALNTGLRKGNVLGLRWKWIDLERKVLTIPATSMKAGAPIGIPLTLAAMSILRRNRGHPDFVFTYKGRQIVSLNNSTWKAACRKAGINNLTFHDLRRSWATRLAIAGVPLDVVMRLGGWRSYAILLRRYSHLQPEHLREHAEAAAKPILSKVRSV